MSEEKENNQVEHKTTDHPTKWADVKVGDKVLVGLRDPYKGKDAFRKYTEANVSKIRAHRVRTKITVAFQGFPSALSFEADDYALQRDERLSQWGARGKGSPGRSRQLCLWSPERQNQADKYKLVRAIDKESQILMRSVSELEMEDLRELFKTLSRLSEKATAGKSNADS